MTDEQSPPIPLLMCIEEYLEKHHASYLALVNDPAREMTVLRQEAAALHPSAEGIERGLFPIYIWDRLFDHPPTR